MSAAAAVECAGCLRPFTLMRAAHQCRSCLHCFCHNCSPQKIAVPERGHKEAVRVCDVCLHAADHRARTTGATTSLAARGRSSSSADAEGASRASYFGDEAALKQRASHAEAMAALRRIYMAKLQPLENAFKFSEFYDSELTDGDFSALPFVLLIGGYSVGKTSFIQYMLERDEIPGSRVGPEPTTDRFVAVMAGRPGSTDTLVPGNAAAVDVNRPFASLSRFGTSFLSKFQVSELSSPLLDSISFVDTPGVLSGAKQTVDRGYSFETVVEWFAARSDRILLFFDTTKLDISDELKRVIESLKSHDDKMRVVLNKADMVGPQELMRVYGALMFSLSKCIRTPEVPRVHVGSFKDKAVEEVGAANAPLFNAEAADLLTDLRELPKSSAVRRINEVVKRARLAKVHALLVTKLRDEMPLMWGHRKVQDKLAMNLEQIYVRVQKAHKLALGDFPTPERFRAGLSAFDLSDFPALSKRMLTVADGALSRDIPRLLVSIGERADEQQRRTSDEQAGEACGNPFDVAAPGLARARGGDDAEEGGGNDVPWAIGPSARKKWDAIFASLNPSGEPPALPGGAVRGMMLESGLPAPVLKRVWNLADCDKDGLLDREEFAVACQLIKLGREEGGSAIPEALSRAFIPPSKR
jgi:GTP-binding protein EngB required for normal cell division